MYIAILKHLDKIGVTIDTIRTGIAAGTKVPPALISEIQERLGYQFVGNTYGMSRCSSLFTQLVIVDGKLIIQLRHDGNIASEFHDFRN